MAIIILLKNGEEFVVLEESVDDILSILLQQHRGYPTFTMQNGKDVRIKAEEVVAIYECEDSDK